MRLLMRPRLSFDRDGKREGEGRALARRSDSTQIRPAVHLDDALGDGETEAGAALLLGDRIVGLLELLEELGLVGRGDARARCRAPRQLNEPLVALGLDRHLALRR